MSRRAHQKVSALKIGAVALVLVLFGLGGGALLPKWGGRFRSLEKLNPSDYYENANSLRGNTYQLEGSIGNSLGWNPKKGRLFGLSVRSTERDWVLPILIPSELQTLNIQKNQKYLAKVKVDDQGILLVMEMTKP